MPDDLTMMVLAIKKGMEIHVFIVIIYIDFNREYFRKLKLSE